MSEKHLKEPGFTYSASGPFTKNKERIRKFNKVSFNKGICFLLRVIDIFSKYAWVIHLKYKNCITITNAFQKILKEPNRKPNKIWIDKGSKFYNRSVKS